MKIIADNTEIGESQSIKKLWASPELIFIAANMVNGGAAPRVHEKNITNTVIIAPGSYLLMSPSGNTFAAHPKNHYYS